MKNPKNLKKCKQRGTAHLPLPWPKINSSCLWVDCGWVWGGVGTRFLWSRPTLIWSMNGKIKYTCKFEKNTINDLWSEYETTSGYSLEKKISNNFFPSMFLTNVCFKNYNKKNIGHHASYLFVLRSDEELTLGTSAWNSLRRFVILSHRRSTIVSFETYPLYLHLPGLVDSYNVVRLYLLFSLSGHKSVGCYELDGTSRLTHELTGSILSWMEFTLHSLGASFQSAQWL